MSIRTGSLVSLAMRVEAAEWAARVPRLRDLLRRAAAAVLEHQRIAVPTEVSVLLTDDDRMRILNRDYRGRDAPTNVLAFSGEEHPAADGTPWLLGDVVLALETVESEARFQAKPLADHVCHLVVHGILHLLGYDHMLAADARAMEAAERDILAKLGVADPYDPAAADVLGSTTTKGDDRRTAI